MSSESWEFDQTIVDETEMPCVIDKTTRLVVAVVVDDGISDGKRDANGKLIAAAPALLAALQEIVSRNEIQHWFNLDQARAAITAATGTEGESA